MRTLYAKVEDMFDDTIEAIKNNDTMAIDRILQQEGEINTLQKEYLARHSQRLCDNKCDPLSALVFVDIINNMEKMADHLTNIAQAARRDFLFQNDIDKPGPEVLLSSS